MTDGVRVGEGDFIQGMTGGLSADGGVGVIAITRANGQTVHLPFATESAGNLLLTVEQVLGALFQQQRSMLKGQDPRGFFRVGARQVSRLQGATNPEGTPVLSIVLPTGVRLDFSLRGAPIRELIDWLEELEAAGQKRPAARH